MSIMYAVVLALVTGTHAATWGAIKDSPFEGFKVASFVRSIVLAVVAATVLATVTDLESTLAPIVLVGVLYATERLATELWKSFLREDDQSAYAIPMRIAVLGRPVDGRFPRYLTGFVVLVGVVLMGGAAAALQPDDGGPLWLLVLVGGIGGWLTAVGGAWKDAPVEGFSGWKFLRSPAVATAWTIVLLPFTDHWVALTVAAAGLSVFSIETYKTFFTGGRPPGKFDGKPVRPTLGPSSTAVGSCTRLSTQASRASPAWRLCSTRGDGIPRRRLSGGAHRGRGDDVGPGRRESYSSTDRRAA